MNLGQLALDAGRMKSGQSRPVVDIITFVEAPWGLGQGLFPVQRVILKCHYGLELDDNEHDFDLTKPIPEDHPEYHPDLVDRDGFHALRVVISDWRRENWQTFSEAGYLRYLYKNKRCNVESITPGHERREIILSIGRRSGKCVLGDTLVLTDRGVRRIDSLGDSDGPEVQPLIVGVAQEGSAKANSKYFYNGGVRDTRTLTTRCGYQLGGTDNHRIKVLTEAGVVEWKHLADLCVGDVVCIHRGTNLWASDYVDCTSFHNNEGRKDLSFPTQLDETWGRLLGYLVGDGLWNYHNRVEVTVEHDETWDTLKTLYTDLLGSYSISMDKRTENTGAIKFNSVGMRRFLHDLGFKLDTERDAKMVPWAIMQSPRTVVQAFLRGLFEADGGVESGGKVVSFSTASERLAREVQTLLLNLGIVSRVKPKPVKGKDYWILTVRGLRSRMAFAERVGFDSHKKMDPLWASLQAASREGGDAESIPHQKAWARKLLESVPKGSRHTGRGWERTQLRTALGNTTKPNSSEQVTYPRLGRVLPVAQELGASSEVQAHFEHLIELDYFYDPVESIEEGQHRVYDLHVPEGESFVANGMTNHNTFISSCIAAYETYKLVSKGHPQGYYGLPDSNVIQIISVATDKDQAGLLYREVHGHFVNCFAGDTEILTNEGIKPIGSLAGTMQTLLTARGAWVEAPIRSFGEQPLYKLVLQRQGVEKVIHTTAGHRWFAKDARKPHRGKGWQEFKTTELRPGKHRLQQVYGRSYKGKVDPSPFGVAHGFTFGDGLTSKGQRHANRVRLIGDKDANMRPYFSMCPQHDRPEVDAVEYTALPNFFRELPSIKENKAYLLGWLMGYFAADGTVTKGGQVRIGSTSLDAILFVRDVCSILGIGTLALRTETRESNLTSKPFTMHVMAFQRETLDETLFTIPAHREAFVAAGGPGVKRQVHWTVKSVEKTRRVEEVFCATVEGDRSFTLADNIATGNCGFFSPYMANATQSFATFQTPQDIDRFGSYHDNNKARFSVKVTFRSCVAKGLRGAGNIVVILDEVAHFTDAGQSGAKAVYDAVTPSTSAFSPKDTDDARIPIGPVEGRIVLISSPLGRQGQFFKLFQIGMRGGIAAQNMLCVEAPTWEVNPTVPASEFEKHYVKDPRVFFTEYGGQFSDRTRGFIEDEKDLLACVDPILRPARRAAARKPHFAGIDIALVGDRSSIAIGHIEGKKVVTDRVDWIQAGVGDFAGLARLDYEDVVDWLHEWSKKFYLVEGIFDQWAGIIFEQALAKRGLKQLTAVHHTKPITSQMWKNFKDLMFDQRLVLYDHPIATGETHCDYIAELLELQEQHHSKYVITVEAPQIDGKYDDMSDALVRMIWTASQHLGKGASFGKAQAQIAALSGLARKQALRSRARAKLGGSHPSRHNQKTSKMREKRMQGYANGLKRGGKG